VKRRSLRPDIALPEVFLYRSAVDFRKGHRGLSAIVEQEIGHNPFSGRLYIFVNRAKSRIKILFWEKNGFVLYYKALAEEKFLWPESSATLLTINGEQLNWLMDGYDIAAMKPHKTLRYETCC